MNQSHITNKRILTLIISNTNFGSICRMQNERIDVNDKNSTWIAHQDPSFSKQKTC